MRIHESLAAFSLFAVCVAPQASASTLLLDGSTSVVKSVGDPLALSISGSPGKPLFLLFDLLPGPTTMFGQSLPLGFSPVMAVVNFGLMPPSGTLTLPLVTPELPGLDSLTIHLLAVLADPAAPFGLDFSNGATLSVVTPPTAGKTRSTLVGRRVALMSTGLSTGVGALLPGASITWSLVQAPAGSTASIAHPTQPFATLTPDLPGDFVVKAQIVKNGIAYAPTTTLHAYRIHYPGTKSGAILASGGFFSIAVEGPPGFELLVDGVTALPGAGGTFGPFPIAFPTGGDLKQMIVAIRNADGTEVRAIAQFFLGQAVSLATGAAKSMITRLNESGLDLAGEIVEAQMQTADLKGAIVSLPKVELVDQPGPFGGTIFSAYADVTDVDYDLPISFAQNATAGGFATTLTMQDLKVTVKINGEIANVPYSVTGTASADPATFTGNLAVTPAGATLGGSFSGHSVNLSNFSLSLAAFPGTSTQLSTITSTLKSYLATQIRNFLASAIAAKVKSLIASILPDFEFSPSLGVSIDLGSTFSVVSHTGGAVSFQLNSVGLAPSPKPGAPLLTEFLGNPTSPPTIPSTGPLGGAFDFAFGMADDFYNSVLAAATRAGFLEGPAGVLLAASGTTFSLTAGQMAQALPNAGFEAFPPDTAVTASFHATSAPVARPTPDGMKQRIRCTGVEVELNVVTAYGEVPIARVAIESDHDFELGLDPDVTLAVKSIVGQATLVVIDAASELEFSDLAQVTDELAKVLKNGMARLIDGLRAPFLQGFALLYAGILSDAIGAAGDFLTWFCDFVPGG